MYAGSEKGDYSNCYQRKSQDKTDDRITCCIFSLAGKDSFQNISEPEVVEKNEDTAGKDAQCKTG